MYYSIQLYFMQEKYIHFTTVEPGYSEIIAIVKGSVGFMHFTIARLRYVEDWSLRTLIFFYTNLPPIRYSQRIQKKSIPAIPTVK